MISPMYLHLQQVDQLAVRVAKLLRVHDLVPANDLEYLRRAGEEVRAVRPVK